MSAAEPKEPLDYARNTPLGCGSAWCCCFLYAPLACAVAFSFNESRRNIVWTGFTTDWYGKAFDRRRSYHGVRQLADHRRFVDPRQSGAGRHDRCRAVALSLSLQARVRRVGRPADRRSRDLHGRVDAGVLLALLPWPTDLPWPLDLGSIVIAHISFSFPFVAVIVRARLASFNRELEEAAKDLGAGEFRAFFDVLVPHMRPALIAGALLAFTLSLDDFVITFFTAGPDTVTFPVKVYSMVRFSVTPEVNAASTLLMA